MNISIYLIGAAAAWVVAQLIKYILGSIKNGRWFDSSVVLHSGNMPSVHTAIVVSLVTVIGLKDVMDTALLACALLLA